MGPNFGGIDFGTSNSTAGLFENGKPRLVPLEDGNVTIPSAVFFNFEDDRTYFGRGALEAYTANTEGRLLRALKSVLGTSLIREKTRIKARSMAFSDIIGGFIAYLKERLESEAGGPVEKVVLGRPVHFVDDDADGRRRTRRPNSKRRRARKGFRHIAFQFEPIAAALDYEQSVTREELALIVDIGGGTSDFSIVRVSPERAKAVERKDDILANAGVHVGGTDFDRLLSIASRHAGARLFDADQGRQAQPAGRLFLRPRDLAAHQPALYVEGHERPAPYPLRGGTARTGRADDRDRAPPARPCAGGEGRTGQDRADGRASSPASTSTCWTRS